MDSYLCPPRHRHEGLVQQVCGEYLGLGSWMWGFSLRDKERCGRLCCEGGLALPLVGVSSSLFGLHPLQLGVQRMEGSS